MVFRYLSRPLILTSLAGASLLLAPLAYAQEYGPPENIPDRSEIPEGYDIPSGSMPSGVQGPPANIPTGPSQEQIEAMQKRGDEQALKGMQQGASGMEKALKRFEEQYAAMEKKGTAIGQSTKEEMKDLRAKIDAIKNAKNASEIEDVDQDVISERMNKLGEDIGRYQKMSGLKKMLASMDRGVVSLEKQLAKLVKQGVVIPDEMKADIAKLKEGLNLIRNAKTPEEMDNANPDELGDLMTKVNEMRPQLEMLAKWPRVLRQADQQIAQFQKQLASTKKLVDRLAAGDIDVSVDFKAFQDDVNSIKVARDEANALMKGGKGEDAFTKLEDDFFNKLDDVGEHQRVIQQMSNLSRFAVEFKRGMASADKSIQQLKRAKKDTTALKAIFDQSVAKGNEILALIKAKPINEEAILSAMDTMENLKQQFQNKLDELTGGPAMPWETKSASTFKPIEMPKDFGKAW